MKRITSNVYNTLVTDNLVANKHVIVQLVLKCVSVCACVFLCVFVTCICVYFLNYLNSYTNLIFMTSIIYQIPQDIIQ